MSSSTSFGLTQSQIGQALTNLRRRLTQTGVVSRDTNLSRGPEGTGPSTPVGGQGGGLGEGSEPNWVVVGSWPCIVGQSMVRLPRLTTGGEMEEVVTNFAITFEVGRDVRSEDRVTVDGLVYGVISTNTGTSPIAVKAFCRRVD